MQTRTAKPENKLEQFQGELDELYANVLRELGETDALYIRRVVSIKKILEFSSRFLILSGAIFWNPVALIIGVVGLSASQIIESMEIGHNVLHGQYDFLNDPKLNSKTYEWDVVVPAEQWKHTHNVIHHDQANIIGKDYDIGYGSIRVTEKLKWNPTHLWQLFTALFMALDFQHLAALHDSRAPEFLMPKAWRPPAVEPRPPWSYFFQKVSEYRRKAVKKVFRDYVFFPALAGPFFLYVLIANLAARALTNIWQFSIIFCGHFIENVIFFKPEDCERETRGQWYVRQILSTGNIEGSALFYFMTGHLSHHIEHHLFPDIPAYRYPEMSREVKKICARYGIPYLTGPFTSQFLTVWKRIAKYSLPSARDSVESEPSNTASLFQKGNNEQEDKTDANAQSAKCTTKHFFNTDKKIATKEEIEITFSESNRKVLASTANSILVSAESNGLMPDFGCRKGVCHTCKVTKNSGRVIDNNTGIVSGDGRELIKICVSLPLTNLSLEL